jgi:hypothetical protein
MLAFIKEKWMQFARILGFINSMILLTFFYLILIGFMSVIHFLSVVARSFFVAQNKQGGKWRRKDPIDLNKEWASHQF